MSFDLLVAVALGYVLLLFAVAFAAERRARRGRLGFLRSPLIYTLSLSIYCTGWTFFGAVGSAARSGLEFLTIYIGPTLVFAGWWWLLRKLVRIGRQHRITSIADLLSSRYGKSPALAVLVTLLAVVASTPYIALQLQSVTQSVAVFLPAEPGLLAPPTQSATAIWVAAGLALFTILFGTRNLDANERHEGVVVAIALEAVVKLVALLAVGAYALWGLGGGLEASLERIAAAGMGGADPWGTRWTALILLSATAIICLPRMFQVTVVENLDERHLATAGWAFPLYLLLVSLAVLPIAAAGLAELPAGANPDLFVLTVPLGHGQNLLALLAFLGGFSAATSMVIVATIALSTMVSNHVVMPIWLAMRMREPVRAGDVRKLLLRSRRISIAALLALGYLYFRFTGGSAALAAIGLISFAGVAQMLPALLGGLFWRGATLKGAMAGLGVGLVMWAYTLFLPSFEGRLLLDAASIAEGPFGIGWLRPQALLGMEGLDPLVHAMLWSLGPNALVFAVVSLLTTPSALERLQSGQFVNIFQHGRPGVRREAGHATASDLLVLAHRILGEEEAIAFFREEAALQGREEGLPDPTPEVIERLERRMAGTVGAAAAHAMISQITGGAAISVEDLIAVADESAQIREYSAELARTAEELRRANARLQRISEEKDAFLSQVSHELRTPMTSIRAFAEILREERDLDGAAARRFAGIIHDESIRLTRLLDDLLDLSVLERGQVALNLSEVTLGEVLDRALLATAALPARPIRILRDPEAEALRLRTDPDRLAQVFINLISNAAKYCAAPDPELRIRPGRDEDGRPCVDFIDNGAGIAPEHRERIFDKFARIDAGEGGGAGLGLAISREIMRNLGGEIRYLAEEGGAAFRVVLPGTAEAESEAARGAA